MRAALLALVVACRPAGPASPEPTPDDRVAEVEVRCDLGQFRVWTRSGSGVLIGGTSVLTAAHLFGAPDVPCPGAVNARVLRGRAYHVVSFFADPVRDLARVTIDADPGLAPAPVGPVTDGRGCSHAAVPVEVGFCGPVTAGGAPGANVELDFRVLPGNSGAGVWQDGRLTAIVTRTCGGPACGWATAVLP